MPKCRIYTPGLAVNESNVDSIIARQSSTAAKVAWFSPIVDKILADHSYLRPLDQAG